MPLKGHATTLKISGTAVAVTGEATTSLGSSRWQVTSTARRIMDPSVAVVVKDGGTPVSSALYSLDYLFGIVTFSGYTPSGAVTFDFSYLPVQTITEVRNFSFSFGGDLQDVTTYDSAGAKQKLAALIDGSGSFEFLSLRSADVDSGTGGTQSLDTYFAAATPKLLEANFGGTYLRAWVVTEGLESSAEVAGLVVHSANFQTAPQKAGAAFGFGS